jgi:hypothetical protein
MKCYRSLAWVLLLVPIAACNQGTDTTLNNGGGTSGMWTIPGVGTMYIYQFPGQGAGFDTLKIVSSGEEIGGKPNVARYRVLGSDTEFHYISYQPNGDISLGDSTNNGFIEWETFPTGSHNPITNGTPLDTFEFGSRVVESDVNSYLRNENLIVAGADFATIHIKNVHKDFEIEIDSTGLTQGYIDTTDYWFAPSIGLYVKVKDLQTPADTTQPQQKIEFDLVKYLPR